MHKHRRAGARTEVDSGALAFSMEKLGVSRFDLRDPYHLALTLSWPAFLVAMVLAYLAINLGFAELYAARPGCVANLPPHALLAAFYFSVETLATVGYGVMAPASGYGHAVATVEIFVGMLFTATMTGLLFVRFSRPKAKILFAARPVIARAGAHPTLMIRIGNGRANALIEAVARATVFVVVERPDGQHFRRAIDLKLERADLPFFALTWTLMHEITPASPLHGLVDDAARCASLRMMVSVTALDQALGAEVHAMRAYRGADLAPGMRYVDAVTTHEDHAVADMRMISAIEAEPA
ncbi:MAG: Inward rectifier potassium channel [Burkholderiales bacterium]|nr:Inward rectifier potassium channel [Burkholderiales bacterium]MDE1929777.1 Inward rectifier potassium channel [Burkholderiales bacterium]MDE2158794.1 Inward rectifier potassium channel [Burkholderiales bacterium]MDE2505167.1 Inward rectifier potassium channel [Burkholderiales bacterium]